jgi:hypothetical protein
LGAVGFGLFKQRRACAVKGFKNLWIFWQRDLHGSDNFWADGRVGSTIRHLTEMVGYIGQGQRDVKE